MMLKRAAALATAAAAVALLAGCPNNGTTPPPPGVPAGPSGTVGAKDHPDANEWILVIRLTNDGRALKKEFVTETVFNECHINDPYPGCAK